MRNPRENEENRARQSRLGIGSTVPAYRLLRAIPAEVRLFFRRRFSRSVRRPFERMRPLPGRAARRAIAKARERAFASGPGISFPAGGAECSAAAIGSSPDGASSGPWTWPGRAGRAEISRGVAGAAPDPRAGGPRDGARRGHRRRARAPPATGRASHTHARVRSGGPPRRPRVHHRAPLRRLQRLPSRPRRSRRRDSGGRHRRRIPRRRNDPPPLSRLRLVAERGSRGTDHGGLAALRRRARDVRRPGPGHPRRRGDGARLADAAGRGKSGDAAAPAHSARSSRAVKSPGLLRGIGLFDATALVVGSMIGSGIFIVSAESARVLGSAGWLLAAWGIAGGLSMGAALSCSGLAAMLPKAGGQYVFFREAYGPLVGFLFGWALFLVIQSGTIAAVAVAFAKFLGVLWPAVSAGRALLAGGPLRVSPAQAVALAVIALLTATNATGLRAGTGTQNVFTAAKLAALLALTALGLVLGGRGASALRAPRVSTS